jgi:hypothetical protein
MIAAQCGNRIVRIVRIGGGSLFPRRISTQSTDPSPVVTAKVILGEPWAGQWPLILVPPLISAHDEDLDRRFIFDSVGDPLQHRIKPPDGQAQLVFCSIPSEGPISNDAVQMIGGIHHDSDLLDRSYFA